MPQNLDSKSEILHAQQQPVEFITLSGGGARGVIYSGVLAALTQKDSKTASVMDGVKAIAGSSAGAITAALIATGIDPIDFETLSKTTNFKDLLGTEGVGMFNKDGKPLYKLMQKTILQNVKKFLDGKDISQNESKGLQDLKVRLDKGPIYFKDLDILRALDPAKFKDLVVTAVNKDTTELKLFNAQETPEVEIALACRASASIPLVFQPVEIDGVKYVDGGYIDNIPTKYFHTYDPKDPEAIKDVTKDPQESKKDIKAGRTLVFAFSEGTPIATAIYSQKKGIYKLGIIKRFLYNYVLKKAAGLGGKGYFTQQIPQAYNNLRENALNVVPLETKDISSLSFDRTTRRANYLHIKGYIDTMRHLHNHDLQPIRDKALEQKEFLLSVYEKSLSPGKVKSWVHSMDDTYKEKKAKILSFCAAPKWDGKPHTNVLKEFIECAATRRHKGNLSSSTTTINNLIKSLNDPTTSTGIKAQFLEILRGSSIAPQSQGFDKIATKYHFTKDDFKKYLVNFHTLNASARGMCSSLAKE